MKYLSTKEVANLASVCEDTVRRWDWKGTLKADKRDVFGKRMYLKTKIEKFLKQRQSDDQRRS